MRCSVCQGLTISRLVALAETEFEAKFPREAFYRHYQSVAELEASAERGCDLCGLIVESLARRTYHPFWDEDMLGFDRSRTETVLESARHRDEQSDVKICISTQHVGYGSPVSDVKMFDQLLVQVGTVDDAASFFASDSSAGIDGPLTPLPTVQILLTSPREQPVYLGRYRIGRSMLDADLSSEANFAIARDWIMQCCRDHGLVCGPAGDDTPLPTRVLDVADPADPINIKVFSSGGQKAKYLALSHCWGGSIATTLTSGTLKDFSRNLPLQRLPLNFQHAVEITRKLAVRYLWIDSLCIIQDSREDWARESGKMASVYQNALLTICALSSAGSAVGIMKAGRIPPGPQHSLQIPVEGPPSVTAELFSVHDDHEDLFGLGQSAPLSLRAWCLQESILSRRVLCYGERQIYWGCGQGLQAADGAPDGEMFPRNDFGPPALKEAHSVPAGKTLPFRGEDLHGLLRRYHRLVQDFSRRSITFDSDKLPAFSGIAQRLHPLIGGEYLAGIWSTDFNDGLLWSSVIGQNAKHVKQYRAPSWSWASTNDAVWTWRGSSAASPTGARRQDDLQLLEHHIQLKDVQNSYGEVIHGHAVVRGQTTRLRREHGAELDRDDQIGNVYFDDREMGRQQTGTELFASEAPQGGADRVFLVGAARPLFRSSRVQEEKPAVSEVREYVVLLVKNVESVSMMMGAGFVSRCLVLTEVSGGRGGGGVYERVGFLETYESTDLAAFEWETRTVKLV